MFNSHGALGRYAPVLILCAASTLLAQAPVASRNGSVFNARDYGAKGDALADDTAAIQQCIDACLGGDEAKTRVRDARGPIYLPAGNYRITRPLRIYSAQHVNFHGDGGSTRLIPIGKLDSVLDLNGCAYSTFRDFRIEGNTRDESVTDAIYCYRDAATAYRSTTKVVFEGIHVANTRCVTAIRAGQPGSGTQCDQIAYRDLTLTGAWKPGEKTWYQHGLFVGDGVFANNLIHSAFNLSSSFWANGVTADATNFAMWGGAFGQNGTDLNAKTLAYFTAQGFRSESSQRLFESIGQSSNDGLYNLSDIVWSADQIAPDGEFVRMRTPGSLSLRNLQITNGGANARIRADSSLSSSIQLNGVLSPNTLAGFLGGCSPRAVVTTVGYLQSDTKVGRLAAAEGITTNGSLDLGGGRKWSKDGLFMSKDRYWTEDGLYPGIGIKWKGSGTLTNGPNESLRYVGWEERPLGSGNRRQGWVVPPLKDK